MKRLLAVIIAILIAPQAYAFDRTNWFSTKGIRAFGKLFNDSGVFAPTITGCTNSVIVTDSSGVLGCSVALVADTSGAGNGVFTFRRTTATAVTDNTGFLNFQGTLSTPVSGTVINGMAWWVAGAGSGAVVQRAMDLRFQAGYTGAAATVAASYQNQAAGTGTDWWGGYTSTTAGGNWGILARSNATTAGSNAGMLADARGGNINVAGVFEAITNKSNATNVGVVATASQTTGTPVVVGVYSALRATAPTISQNAVYYGDNLAIAAPLLVLSDNSAAVPSTGATATFQILDGAQPQNGNGVLTNATMTAETQGQLRTVISSYTWTNAQVVALGAVTAGDITVATLPAKTRLKNAYVVITGAAAGPATVTVSCGDAVGGTPFINYVVASDAKAAANTVYGDAVAERGTSIDVEWYYLPSYTGTTLVTCHFISTGANLDTVTGSTGRVILETALQP